MAMIVPSYDDLTPGIPDVESAEAVPQLALFLDNSQLPTPDSQLSTPNSSRGTASIALRNWELGVGSVFACLRLQAADGNLQTLVDLACDFSPRVMRVGGAEVLLDVSGLGRLIGEPPAIVRELARALRDARVEASAAIGPTQTTARLLATQVPDYPIARVPDLPVTVLRPLEAGLPGCATAAMNHRDRARPYDIFDAWGIRTLGELAALPAAALRSRLGRRGAALQRLARGDDPRPFVPDPDTPRYVERLELEWPIDALEPLSFVLARLLDPLSAALERADRAAAALRLELRLTDRSTCTRVLALPAPLRDPRVLRTLLLLDLESHPPFSAIDIVAIELDPAPARITQFSLLARALPSPETVSTLTARLSALLGESRIGSPVPLDSHRPDAFEMRAFAPERDTHSPGFPNTPDLKVGPTGGSVLRRLRNPPALRVRVERGRPVHVSGARRGLPSGAVTQAAGPWRTSGDWWSWSGRSGAPRAWNKDEWDVALPDGALCCIYQDRTTERWFLEGTYD